MAGENFYIGDIAYDETSLLESAVVPNGLEQLHAWIREALDAQEPRALAMALATSTFEGKPSVRTVWLRRIDERGLYFFSNFQSKKGKQLLQNPYAAICFYWPQLQREVRVEGTVSHADGKISDEYFSVCDQELQLTTWAFPQSQVVASRKYLETLLTDFKEEFGSKGIKRPTNWGGYVIEPQLIELWQGVQNGVHDRLQYTLFNGEWRLERLAP